MNNLIYIGLDVDDAQYHGAGWPAPTFDKETGDVVRFNCRPTLKSLVSQLKKMRRYFTAGSLKLSYEES